MLKLKRRTQKANQKVSKRVFIHIIYSLCFYLSITSVYSQSFHYGTIKEYYERTTIPYVNVFIKGKPIGTVSNEEGVFELEYTTGKPRKDSIVFSFIGYKTKTISLKDFKNESVIYLKHGNSLNEVVLSKRLSTYEEYLLDQIISNKKKNDPHSVKKKTFKEISFLSVSLSNLDSSFIKKRVFRKNEDAFIAQRDSTFTFPVFFSKEIIKHYVDRNKNIETHQVLEKIEEGALNRLKNTVKNFINFRIAQDINFYDENIDFLGRSFKSPIASDYKSYYKIYLSDSTLIDGVKHYKFGYYPKDEKSIAFDGSFWVESETFALTEIEAALPNLANVNFINGLEIDIAYHKASKYNWFVKSRKSKTKLSFSDSKEIKYFSIEKNQNYLDFQLDVDNISTISSSSLAVTPKGIKRDSLEIGLNPQDVKIIESIENIQDNLFVKFLDKFGGMTLSGYYNLGKVDIGPYFDLFYRNGIEGRRVTLPLRTSEKVNENFTVGGYIGYGSKDKEAKFGFETKFKLPLEKRTVLSFKYFNDYRAITPDRYLEFVRENPFSQGSGNILSVFTRTKDLNYNLLKQRHFDITFTHEVTQNARYLIRPFYDRYTGNEFSEFNTFNHNSINVNTYQNYGAILNLRYSKSRSFDQHFFSRFYYRNPIPIYQLTVEIGENKISENSINYTSFYTRFNAAVKKKVLLGSMHAKTYLDIGYIHGDVPYPLLRNSSGNQSIGLARFNYNLLNVTSFSSDFYTNLHIDFNGGGILFNRIPFLSEFNVRESLSFKMFYGTLRDDHNKFLKIPGNLVELNGEPYAEIGVGLINIAKFLRIEYVRRLNTGTFFKGVSSKHGIKARFEITF